jgi:hypothetical protein
VITALSFMVFMILLALVLDIGHLTSIRGELQNAADASAMAGARSLAPLSSPGNRLTPLTGNPSCATAATVACQLINRTENQDIAIAPWDVQIGHWGWPGENYAVNQFTPISSCSVEVNAVRVLTRKDQSLNQPVFTWFAHLFGITSIDLTSRPAVGALGYVAGVEAGRVFPIAINADWLRQVIAQPVPEDGIKFNPDGQDNGGWASPITEQPSAANLKQWINSGYPERISFDDLISLNNGTVDSAIQEVKQQLPGHTRPYTLAGGTSHNGWLVLAPVVEKDRFNQNTPVVTFQPMIIKRVDATGNPKTIQVVFYDKPVIVDGGIPGGPKSNLYANLPRLVQ